MIKQSVLLATLLVATAAAQANVIFTEDFDDIGTLGAGGWSQINNSSPIGDTGWFQGNLFDAQSGAANSYIAANFLNAAPGGTISNWLLTPTLTLFNGDSLSFYTRTAGDAPFADRLELRLSQNGASSDVGDFTTLALTVNPALGDGYPSDWTRYSVTFSGLADDAQSRVAFRYFVPDTNTNGDYIGIDSVTVSAPEPSSIALLLVSLLPFGLAVAKRRKRNSAAVALTMGAALAASSCAAVAAEPAVNASTQSGLMSFPNVSVVNAPAAAKAQPSLTRSASGMRIYIDPQTKQIREATREEAIQEAKPAISLQRRTDAAGARSSAVAPSAGGEIIYGPGNTVGLTLGEDTMVFEVAHRESTGATRSQCITGKAAADKALVQAATIGSHGGGAR